MCSSLWRSTLVLLVTSAVVKINEGKPSVSRCSVSWDEVSYGFRVDCHNKGLAEIPGDFPENTTSIDLSQNNITTVPNNSFSRVRKLQYLSLYKNEIKTIELHGFAKCPHLLALVLSGNNIYLNGSLLDNLTELTSLSLDGRYDARVFQHLRSLTSLDIFATEETSLHFVGADFLKSLESVTIRGSVVLHNNTFTSLSGVKVTTLCINALVPHLEVNTFSPLKYLRNLSMIKCQTRVKMILAALHGLVGRNLTMLEISRVSRQIPRRSRTVEELEDKVLKGDALKYLKTICIQNLSLSGNDILFLDIYMIETSLLGSCLELFDISKNRLYNFDMHAFFFQFKFTNLRYCDVSDQSRVSLTTSFYSQCFSAIAPKIDMSYSKWSDDVFIVTFPPNLEYFNFSHCTKAAGNIRAKIIIRNGKNVRVVDISYNGITMFTGITGLDNIEYFDVSGNEGLRTPDNIFDNLLSIQTLKLRDGSFSQTVLNTQGKRFFRSLPNLQSLDLSGNRLVEIPADIFDANTLLRQLDLSRNAFIHVPVDLNLNASLEVIDLSFNSIGSLNKITRSKIDMQYVKTNNTFFLNLNANLLSCSCENFNFIFWLSETIVYDFDAKNLSCLSPEGHLSYTGEINSNFLQFWRRCTGSSVLFLSGLLFSAIVSSLFLALLVATNKTMIVNILVNALRRQIARPERRDFLRDVYVSYAEADYQWVCHQLRPALEDRNLTLFIWDRDSVPGDSIPDQIAETIPRCWRTIIYYTENYQRDPWTYMSMAAAINCVDNLSPERILLLLPEGQTPRLPDCLLQVVPESCIFHVPADATRDDPTWGEIRDIISN